MTTQVKAMRKQETYGPPPSLRKSSIGITASVTWKAKAWKKKSLKSVAHAEEKKKQQNM